MEVSLILRTLTGERAAVQFLECASEAPGKTEIAPKTWHHLALVYQRGQVFIYLDGKTDPEIFGKAEVDPTSRLEFLFIGGRENGPASFEGKIDEVALFDRALSIEEIAGHLRASRNVIGAEPTRNP